jgi:multidrug efflux pump subunit AcrA (membrane-fusion protein)
MNARAIIVGGCMAVSSLGAAAMVRWRPVDPAPVLQQGDPGAAESAVATAAVGAEEREYVEARHVIGLVVPAAQVTVRAPVDGTIAAIVKRPTDVVEAGEVLMNLDDGDVALEAERQKATLAAAVHHVDAARADVELLELRLRQLRPLQGQRAAALSEVAQVEAQLRASVARAKAMAEERRGHEVRLLELSRRADSYRVRAPIAGEVAETCRVAREYVRAGEAVATLRSVQHRIRLHLPATLEPGLPRLRFTIDLAGRPVALAPAEVAAEIGADGSRPVMLIVPPGVGLSVGQIVSVDVQAHDESLEAEAR